MFRIKDYISEINQNETWKKYFSAEGHKVLLDFLVERQWLPSQFTINRAIAELNFTRTDGGSARKDAADFRRKAQSQFDEACANAEALPLTPEELAEYASLSFADLQKKYWAEGGDFFRVRYGKAAKTLGYKIPPRPQVENETAEAVALTAEQYRSMPSSELQRRLRIPSFKMAVYKLIQQGLIVLVLGFICGGI